jgi:hypothetical protein
MPEQPIPEPPPPLGSWRAMYSLVGGLAVVVMLLLIWFTSAFNLAPVR